MASVPAAHTETRFTPGNGWLIGIVLAVLTFWLFAQTLLNVIPVIQTDLDLAVTTANLAVTITALFAGVFIVVAGGLGDRFGHTAVFRIGVVLSIIGSLLLILTPRQAGALTATTMLGGRIIQGLSIACIMPASLALINRFFHEKERQRAVSFFSIGTFGGLGLASLVGGVVASLFGWRSIFVVSILASLLALFLTRRTPILRGTRADNRGSAGFDWGGLASFLLAVVGLNVYISEGPEIGWASLAGLGLIGLTVVAFVAFLTIDLRRARAAFIDLSMFKNMRFSGPVLANFLMNATAGVIITTLSVMQRGAGWTSLQAGLLTIGHLLAVLSMIRVGEKLLQRFGIKRPMLWGAMFDCVGVALAACTFLPQPVYLVVAFIGLAMFGTGQGLFATPAIDAAISSVPSSEVGVAGGILKMGSTLGQAIGVALSATIAAVGSELPAAVVASWGLFRGWDPAAASVRFGGLLGSGLLVVIALIMIVAIVVTVPGRRQESWQ